MRANGQQLRHGGETYDRNEPCSNCFLQALLFSSAAARRLQREPGGGGPRDVDPSGQHGSAPAGRPQRRSLTVTPAAHSLNLADGELPSETSSRPAANPRGTDEHHPPDGATITPANTSLPRSASWHRELPANLLPSRGFPMQSHPGKNRRRHEGAKRGTKSTRRPMGSAGSWLQSHPGVAAPNATVPASPREILAACS